LRKYGPQFILFLELSMHDKVFTRLILLFLIHSGTVSARFFIPKA